MLPVQQAMQGTPAGEPSGCARARCAVPAVELELASRGGGQVQGCDDPRRGAVTRGNWPCVASTMSGAARLMVAGGLATATAPTMELALPQER